MVVKVAASVLLATSFLSMSGALAAAEQPAPAAQAVAESRINTDLSAQQRRPPRIRIYGGTRQLPPNAVRQCRAWYVQEHRVSGTYVVPRMQCWWEY